ncbi:RDD family protein [Stackebrandtia nassauensis]|uniref:RDD domain containing protein n=1 Tax=Stackebrandtia nassauensis (strain DSM 44728 / CIP 108903 / NRRL B-16338 / NBRC 102104 / LLR-40K-21) TaxID=446470 RepID=D3Q336_STANL|nr:RDD family protein [Stackebrandtia nassauensis]ADD40006.1 RDD domain containing protein [Stackebrandtia nassauensis DSM 44728]
MTDIEPGWYRDPAAPETQRYWDGEQWVGKPVDINATPPTTPEPLPEPVVEPEPVRREAAGPDPAMAAGRGSLGDTRMPLFAIDQKKVDRLLEGKTLAHPGQRLVARIIDIIVVLLLNAVVNGWFIYQYFDALMPTVRRIMADPNADYGTELPTRAYQLQYTILFIAILVWFAYEIPSTVKSGQTLGKRIMGIKAVPIYAERMRWGLAISRWSLMMLSLACCPIGFVAALIDGLWCLYDKPFRQCLHDKNPGTMVIQVPHDELRPKGATHVPPTDPR